ncbi:MAG: hypothetical protein AAF289_13565 [Cyanobacteria bacterium P01_A01_bin.135]
MVLQTLSQPIADSRLHNLARHSPSKEEIKQEIRQRIRAALNIAKTLSPEHCAQTIRVELDSLKRYCESVNKTFIVVEEAIACHQYGLGGSAQETATLFRGPDERATVAICVTQRGSILHRNDSGWMVYRHMGDLGPL